MKAQSRYEGIKGKKRVSRSTEEKHECKQNIREVEILLLKLKKKYTESHKTPNKRHLKARE